ncbi:MAG: DNA recombination protein RmuC [Alphaproteobacteria bacterium]|nr:DNA recombination protein RmuC [Alphaproteobacteria bacterium]
MLTIILAAAAALFAGLAVGFLLGRGRRDDTGLARREAEVAQLKPLAEQVPALREKLAAEAARWETMQPQIGLIEPLRLRAERAESDNAALKAKLESSESHFAEQIRNLTQLREEVQNQFKLLAADVLKEQKETAKADISTLLEPLSVHLRAYDEALQDIESKRIKDVSAVTTLVNDMKTQQDQVRAVTANLVGALRASPKTRGRWGEETLRRVMELSGMVERCDFETEKFFPGDESLRPDAVVSVAGGRAIVVDAKAPVSAYLDAIGAATDEERELLLKRHAQQLRERLMNLSQKSYWERIGGTTDCVVMFVPGDNFVSAAFERDPDLFQDGINARVLICTPTTFIALAKAISYGWNQEKLARNAAEVGRMGKELYARLSTMGDHVLALGKNLGGAVEKYNKMVGSLETKVMPQARKFHELGVEGTGEPLAELGSVDTVIKFPQGGRDLMLSGGET